MAYRHGKRSSNRNQNAQALLERSINAYQTGEMQQAAHWAQQTLAQNPDIKVAHDILGFTLPELGQVEGAIAHLESSLTLELHAPDILNKLASLLINLGRFQEALPHLEHALTLQPDFAGALNNLGAALFQLQRLEEAATHLERAIALEPNFAEAWNNLGALRSHQQRLEEASNCFQKASAIQPDNPETLYHLATTLTILGRNDEAIACYQRLVAMAPNQPNIWHDYAQALHPHTCPTYDVLLAKHLLTMHEGDFIDTRPLVNVTISLLQHHPTMQRALGLLQDEALDQNIVSICETLGKILLLLKSMALNPIANSSLEQVFTRLREAVLHHAVASEPDQTDAGILPFLSALAQHCFIHDYVYAESDKERTLVNRLSERLDAMLAKGAAVPVSWVAIACTYLPLHHYTWCDALESARFQQRRGLEPIITQQLKHVRHEANLRKEIPRLTAIEDDTSQAVRRQYEESPYPRWQPVRRPSFPVLRFFFTFARSFKMSTPVSSP